MGELEDKSVEDKEQIEAMQLKTNDLLSVIDDLKSDLEKQKQREEYMNNQQTLMSDKLERNKLENENKINQINALQTDLSVLRQFKHDTQQQNIQNMMKQEQQNAEMNQLKQQIQQKQLQYQQELNLKNNEKIKVEKELNDIKMKNEKLMLQTEKIENEKEEIIKEKKKKKKKKKKNKIWKKKKKKKK